MKTSSIGFMLLLTGLACAQGALAQTISYGDAMTKLAQDCGADVKKYCDGVNLGGGRMSDCLQKNAAKLSPTCTGSLAGVFSSIERREQAQAAYQKACRRDIAQRCKGVKGDGYILVCLNKAQGRLKTECNQTIIDAGWR